MKDWQKRLLERLGGFSAPRVLSLSELAAFANEDGEAMHVDSVRRFARGLEQVGAFIPVRKGLWVNAKAVPSPSVAEAAARIRAGAVVSLQSVLGDAGVLNNFSSQVFCVLPITGGAANPTVTSIDAGGTIFHFKGIKESVLKGGDASDRLSSLVHYPRATAEAALVHWMYLAHNPRSRMPEPDTQCDVSMLDTDRLERLSSIAGVRDETFDWVRRCAEREELDDEQVGWHHGPA